jgi:anoctamin-10
MRSHQHQSGSIINGTTTISPGKVIDSMIYSSDPAHSPRSPLSFSNLLPSFLPTSGTAGALIGALLLALTCEHLYGFFLASIRHALERALWRGSEEETKLRRRDWEQRQEAINRKGLGNTHLPQKAVEKISIPDDAFWSSQSGDVGLSVIQGISKTE